MKDDARHDPQVTEEEIVREGVASADEVEAMSATGRRVFTILEEAWGKLGVQLVDLKIEYGRDAQGTLLVADVIDNDSWRLWPGGDKSRMLDKQIYRNMPEVTDERLRDLLNKYAQVAELTDKFVEEEPK